MVFFSDVSGLLTSDGGDMGMVGGWVKVISGEVSNGTVISGESPPMTITGIRGDRISADFPFRIHGD